MAARRLIDSWTSPSVSAEWSIDKLVGHLSLLLSFRRPDVALDVVIKLHDKGFVVPPMIAARILSLSQDELLANPDKLGHVLKWVANGFDPSQQRAKLEHELVLVVLTTFKKLGRTDLAGQVFEMWADGLDENEVGAAKVWSAAISLHAMDKNTAGAYHVFNLWRARWKKLHGPNNDSETNLVASVDAAAAQTPMSPPDEPYSTMLNYLATQKPGGTLQRDPVYRFLATVRDDRVPLTVHMYNALMRVELVRRRFISFWGLWQRLTDSIEQRNATSWRLAVQAKVARDLAGRLRGRKRIGSPMHEVIPHFNDSAAPSARLLFRQLLDEHLRRTRNEPRRRLSTKEGVVLSTIQLNTFLDMFVNLGDWVAAQIVLETFKTHRIEPDEQTHARVVVGVVKLWERDKLQVQLDEARNLDWGGRDRQLTWQDKKRAALMGGREGLEMIQKIVDQRKMRVNLWTRDGHTGGSSRGDSHDDEVKMETDRLPPAPWMLQREVRELGYLTSLLRRCHGATEAEWEEQLAQVRAEMVPKVAKTSRHMQQLPQ
ncbi:hypothetical protein ACM66B_005024 [Microbotryomycetes sp. NB124-2]